MRAIAYSHMSKIAAVLVATLVLSACGGPEPIREPVPLQAIDNPAVAPSVAWKSSGGNGSDGQLSGFQLAVSANTIYVANGSGRVAALDTSSGKTIWKAGVDQQLVSGPAVAGDKLLVGTRDGRLLALSAANGEQQWSTRVASEVIAPPAAGGGLAVVHTLDGRLVAYNLADGNRLWTVDRSVPSLTMRGVSKPLIRGSLVFAGLDNGHVIALDLSSGQMLWEQTVAVPAGASDLQRMVDIDANPEIAGNTLLAVSVGGKLAALDVTSGRVHWKANVAAASGIAYTPNAVFTTDLDGVVHATDRRSGTPLWRQDALKFRDLSAPAIYNGYLVVGDYEGYLHWIDPRTGDVVGRIRALSSAIRNAPLVVNGELLVLGVNGGVAAIQAGTNG